MYPFEKFMKTLKGFVKNRARPEGFIAECYLAEERMIFCSAYIKKASTIGVHYNRNDDLENGLVEGRSISKGKEKILEDHVLQAAHRYVLFNTAEVEPYLHYVSCHTTCLIRSLRSIEKMSKMGKKRSKASADEIQEHVASRLSGMNTKNSANSSQDLLDQEPIDDNKPDKKKGRGASKLKMISGQDKRKEVKRNEFGQPIGDNSVTYASFLGCMIKEFVPYTLDGWNDIDEEVKDRMWSCLQEKSAKFRAMREKQDHIHTMSRRGYARLTHIMKQIQECPPESQNTINIADDAISLVFGKENRGKVRGMGFGVTPSKVGAYVQQNGTVKQLQDMVHNLQQEMQEMKSMFLQSMRQQNQQEHVASGGIGSGIGNEVGSNSDINIGAKKSCDFDNVKKHLATAQSNLKNVSCGDICANSKCKLLHWSVDRLVVAEG
ncbi:uncharacterized protein [Primulina huaijiensis]|uniref:uncharacterized protein isoform X1 n=1 Tax=Primulina huaijiensis TaxID=1492673 RepID=UPI003CC769C3